MTKKYAPLRTYLENLPASRTEVGLRFEDIHRASGHRVLALALLQTR